MHGVTFLHNLAIVMITAGVVTVLFYRREQLVAEKRS